jgi:hypothetical protein
MPLEVNPEAPRPGSQMGETTTTEEVVAKAGEALGKEPTLVVETPTAEVTPVEGGSKEKGARDQEVTVTSARPHQKYLLAIVVSGQVMATEGAAKEGMLVGHVRSHALALQQLWLEESERQVRLDTVLGGLELLHRVRFADLTSPLYCSPKVPSR